MLLGWRCLSDQECLPNRAHPGSASHLVPITPLITHVSGCLGSSGGNACWGEEARLLLTVGDDTGCPVCSLGPEWSPGAEQSRGLENKEPGDVAKKGAQGGCRKGQHQAPSLGNKPPPPPGGRGAEVRDQRDLGLHPCDSPLCDAGQVTYLSEHVCSSTKGDT